MQLDGDPVLEPPRRLLALVTSRVVPPSLPLDAHDFARPGRSRSSPRPAPCGPRLPAPRAGRGAPAGRARCRGVRAVRAQADHAGCLRPLARHPLARDVARRQLGGLHQLAHHRRRSPRGARHGRRDRVHAAARLHRASQRSPRRVRWLQPGAAGVQRRWAFRRRARLSHADGRRRRASRSAAGRRGQPHVAGPHGAAVGRGDHGAARAQLPLRARWRSLPGLPAGGRFRGQRAGFRRSAGSRSAARRWRFGASSGAAS